MSNASLFQGVVPRIVDVVRNSSALAAKDTKFYASIDEDLRRKFEKSGSALLDLANKLLDPSSSSPTLGYGILEATSDGSWKKVADKLDSLFEKIDTDIDAMKLPKNDSSFQYLDDPSSSKLNFQVKTKPQTYFKIPVDNSDESPFRPKLTSKPHALVPLEVSLVLKHDEDGIPFYDHPYAKEILEYPYPESILQVSEPIPSLDWRQSKATWVDTLEGLASMMKDLEQSTEIAVDLEHHDLRSYYGITCLMQISNREKDWIIDTLSLRDDMHVLNTVFANPNIIKVFHGASMDIIWLQRDLGLYIVSLFDTYFASKSLGLQRFSLAFLLEHFANFRTSKKYQLADWRVRPIPSIMLDYARADTHFLLNIYDLLRNKLIANGGEKMQEVLHQSRKVAGRKFEFSKFRKNSPSNAKFSFNDGDTARYFVSNYNIPHHREKFANKIFEWRDEIARKYDESPRFVMSNQIMANICQIQHPATTQNLKSCLNAKSTILIENFQSLFDLVSTLLSEVEVAKNVKSESELQNEVLTLNSAKEICEAFTDFIREDNSSGQTNILESISKDSILKNCFTSSVFSIQVPDTKRPPQNISIQELHERVNVRNANRETYTMVISTKEQDDDNINELTQVNPQDEAQNDAESIQRESVGDQLITLMKSDTERKPVVARSEEINSPSFNYKSNEISVLSAPEENKKRKRSFEPYNRNSASGPYKGRKVAQVGKSTSFSKKRY